jgi:hypothetical protein
MAKLSHSVSAELRLFAFYLSNGSFSKMFEDILSDDFDYDRLLCEPKLLERVFAIFANTLEIDDNGEVLNSYQVYRRVAQYIRSEFDQDYIVEPPFESWEIELHI